MYKIIGIFLAVLVFTGCAKEVEVDKPAEYYEELGNALANEGKYLKAAERYEQALVRAETPDHVASLQLSLADSYFLGGKYEDAIPVYEVYLDVYKGWENIKHATVRLGLAYFNLVRYASQDQTNTEKSLYYLEEVKNKYPELVEEYDVDIRISLLRERLAKKEMIIGNYYGRILKKEPQLLRYKYVIENYSDTIYYGEAVYKICRLLLKQNKLDEAKGYAADLSIKDKSNKYVLKTNRLILKYEEKMKINR